jgi:hypothetical protein
MKSRKTLDSGFFGKKRAVGGALGDLTLGPKHVSGWWFGTFIIFHNIWDNPSH